MDGLGLPIAGALLAFCFTSSLVFLFGSWILADMNLAAEYGPSYD